MEELYSKFREILSENNRIKHENIDLKFKIEQLEEELKINNLPRDVESETNWFSSKQKELIEENIILKSELELCKKEIIREHPSVNEMESKVNSQERKLLNSVLEENRKVKDENLRNCDFERKTELLLEQNRLLKFRCSEIETELESCKNYTKRFMKIITGLLGYKIELEDQKITLMSLYAFDSDDIFVFNLQDGDKLQLTTNDFTLSWKNEIQNYLVNGKSLPAFLSCITLELFNKKTFG